VNARAFLVRGLLAGLLAGLATFAVAYVVGEPQVDKAISIEESGAAPAAVPAEHSHAGGPDTAHTHDEGAAVVSRQNQSTWGLATGTVAVGVTIGGLLALVAAGAMGRIANLSPGTSTALVGAIGYASFVLIPFLKYPATPPAVGDGGTIAQRTALYFTFAVVSLVAAAACTVLAAKVFESRGVEGAVLVGIGTYLVIVVLVGASMPRVDEIGAFPGDVLWDFRRASIVTLTALWATACIALTMLIRRLHVQELTEHARREFAASL
jgi:hypothetical protein